MENENQAPNTGTELFKVGTLVSIRDTNYHRVRIVELRGRLGPNGAMVYRIRLRKKPRPSYVEVLESQLSLAAPSSSRTTTQ